MLIEMQKMIVHDQATNTGCKNRYDGLSDDEVRALEPAIRELTEISARWRRRAHLRKRAIVNVDHLIGEW